MSDCKSIRFIRLAAEARAKPAAINSQGRPRAPPCNDCEIKIAKTRQANVKTSDKDSSINPYTVEVTALAMAQSASTIPIEINKMKLFISLVPQGAREFLFQPVFHGQLAIAVDTILDINFNFRNYPTVYFATEMFLDGDKIVIYQRVEI
jgi:hypothetical protein